MKLNRRDVLVGGVALGVAGCATVPGGAPVGGQLYYLGGAKVFSINPAGGEPKVLVDRTAATEGQRGLNDGIALDLAPRKGGPGHIYWTNMGKAADQDGYLMRSDLDGSNVTEIVPPGGAWTPKQMKIDYAGGKLYWSDREGMAVMRSNLDGSGIETLVATGSPVVDKGKQNLWCVGIALDVARRQIYWTQKGGDNAGQGLIRRCGMDMPRGANPVNRADIVTLFSRLPEPIDMDLDLTKRQMYWTDRGDNTISRAPMDPPGNFDPAKRLDKTTLVRGLKEAIGVSLDLKHGRMAYTSLGGEVGVSKLDGSGAKMLATGQGALTGIVWG